MASSLSKKRGRPPSSSKKPVAPSNKKAKYEHKLSEPEYQLVSSFLKSKSNITPSAVRAHFSDNEDLVRKLRGNPGRQGIYRIRDRLTQQVDRLPGGRKPLTSLRFRQTLQKMVEKEIEAGEIAVDSSYVATLATGLVNKTTSSGNLAFPTEQSHVRGKLLIFSPKWCIENIISKLSKPMSYRTVTGKTDAPLVDAPSLGLEFHQRLAILSHEHNIPAERVFHWDQTGILLVARKPRTWAKKGARHVNLSATDDKRCITHNMISNMTGRRIACQLFFEGKAASTRAIPQNAKEHEKFSIFCYQTDNHWTSVQVQMHGVNLIIAYLRQLAIDSFTPPETMISWHFILNIDVFPTHHSDSFLTSFNSLCDGVVNPYGHIVYTPATLTSLFNPHDLTVNRKIKSIYRNARQRRGGDLALKNVSLDDDGTLSFLEMNDSITNASVILLKEAILADTVEVVHFFDSEDGRKLTRCGYEAAGFPKMFQPDFRKQSLPLKDTFFKESFPPTATQSSAAPAPKPSAKSSTSPAPKPSAKSSTSPAPKPSAKSSTSPAPKPSSKSSTSPAPKPSAPLRKVTASSRYGIGYWMSNIDMIFISRAFQVRQFNPQSYETLLDHIRCETRQNWHLEIYNTGTSASGGIHWVLVIWRSFPARYALIIDPMKSNSLSNPICTTLIQAGVTAVSLAAAVQKDSWRCGYITLFWFLQMVGSTAKFDPTAFQLPICPPTWERIVWELLEFRDRRGDCCLLYLNPRTATLQSVKEKITANS